MILVLIRTRVLLIAPFFYRITKLSFIVKNNILLNAKSQLLTVSFLIKKSLPSVSFILVLLLLLLPLQLPAQFLFEYTFLTLCLEL